ncbi:cellulose biosynthesis protein BcsS [Terrihabitans sp. B22-R8]|uniref:cellulose biosynthesis protein BcsS n=1 Tax=Terrihabitans sp. B22-R8 TaxID=3425128 RepID=UPI00403CD669
MTSTSGFRGAAWAFTLLFACMGSASAEPDDAKKARNVLFFSGADLSTVSNFTWVGVDAPLFGPRDVSGPILRIVGGTGRYSYNADIENGHVNGEVVTGEFLAGWRILRPRMWAAALVGLEVENHALDRIDPDNEVQGTGVGVRIAGELSWKPTDRTRLDVSGAYGSAFDLYRARIAGGYAIIGNVLSGLEAESFKNSESDQQRLGLFVEGVPLGRLTLKASAGALHDDDGIGAYSRFGADIYW